MNNTKSLLSYFLFLVGFSLLLVECDRLFPSKNNAPNPPQSTPTDIKNIILRVPSKPASGAAQSSYENKVNKKEIPYFFNGSFSPEVYLTAYNYSTFNNYALRSGLQSISQND